MEKNELSGIERELVLKYLIDGNVPLTITPVSQNEKTSAEEQLEIHSLSSEMFSVAIPSKDISVLKQGIILLTNPPEKISSFEGKKVKVEFYFNRLGLFFITEMKKVSSGPALVIPQVISRIKDVPIEQKYDFSAKLYYSLDSSKQNSLDCVPAMGFKLFSRPVWSSIDLENQKKAKNLLEKFVLQARKSGKAGNGVHLINICRYMVEDYVETIESIQGRLKPLDILFVNHERIVLASELNEAFSIQEGGEYPLEMTFVLKDSPSVSRKIFVTCRADTVFYSDDKKIFAADCSYTSLQEEDCRFLYEKATKTLFV